MHCNVSWIGHFYIIIRFCTLTLQAIIEVITEAIKKAGTGGRVGANINWSQNYEKPLSLYNK